VNRRGRPDLGDLHHDDALLDALSWGDDETPGEPDPARALLAALRADVLADPPPVFGPLPLVAQARVPAPRHPTEDPAGRPPRRRVHRMLPRSAAAGVAAALVLGAAGVAAASVTATPGNPLYGLRRLIIGPVHPHVAPALVAVDRLLDSAQAALGADRLTAAASQLADAARRLAVLPDDAASGPRRERLAALTALLRSAVAAAGHPAPLPSAQGVARPMAHPTGRPPSPGHSAGHAQPTAEPSGSAKTSWGQNGQSASSGGSPGSGHPDAGSSSEPSRAPSENPRA